MNDNLVKHIVDQLIELRTATKRRRKFMEVIMAYIDNHEEEVKEAISRFNRGYGCLLPYTTCDGCSCGDDDCVRLTLRNILYNANCNSHTDVGYTERERRRR